MVSTAPSPWKAGLLLRCPQCGQGEVFQGYLKFRDTCRACGADFRAADAGDGPAVFVILIVGFIIAGAALLVEVAWGPPVWVHVVLWTPLVLLLCLGTLRPLKGVLVALQYHHGAEQGRIDRPG
jgi:uncharacterized protein (DUF983 family)